MSDPEKQRLLRRNWGSDTQGLAEELYAMATDTSPIQTSRQIISTPPEGQPALTVDRPNGDTGTPPVVTKSGEATIPVGSTGDVTVGGTTINPGSLDLTLSGGTPDPNAPPVDKTTPPPVPAVGRVKSGSGTSYVVTVFFGPPSASGVANNASGTLPATAMGVAPGEQIRADTWVSLVCYYEKLGGVAGGFALRVFIVPPLWVQQP